MTKSKLVKARNAKELAKVLGLSALDAHEWEVQSVLLQKLVEIVQSEKFTHSQVATAAKTSRTRITSILNGNLEHVSTDLLIRILGALGYAVRVTIARSKLAA